MTNIASLTFLSNIREVRAVKDRLTKLTFPFPAVSDLAMSSIWEISKKPKKTIKLLRYFTKSALDVSPLFQCSKMTRVGGSKLNRIITHEISVGNLDKLLRTLPDSFFRYPPSLSSLKRRDSLRTLQIFVTFLLCSPSSLYLLRLRFVSCSSTRQGARNGLLKLVQHYFQTNFTQNFLK